MIMYYVATKKQDHKIDIQGYSCFTLNEARTILNSIKKDRDFVGLETSYKIFERVYQDDEVK